MTDSNNDESITFFIIDDEPNEYFGIGKFETEGGSFERSSTKSNNQKEKSGNNKISN